MYKTEIEPYEYLPCSLKVFTINGIKDFADDFVESDWHAESGYNDFCSDEDDEPYGCHCSCVKGLNLTHEERLELMKKYRISDEDIDSIISELESVLYVGRCGLCS